jgi:eukaryotic-like serine/threonine-protein kinase
MAMSSCPSDDCLRSLGLDSLEPAAFAALDAHVEDCVECRQRIEWLCRESTEDEPTLPCRPPGAELPRGIPGFAIEREIGRGSAGVVYLARDQRLGRQIALKVMPDSPRADHRARKRWLKEAQAYSRVRHANVVSLFDVGETSSWLYLVLEYVAGGTLKKRLAGPVPARAAAGFMVKVADAVEHIHSAGQLHLDLKPSNILLDSELEVPLDQVTPKVADFGIARLKPGALADGQEAETTITGAWGGTPAYMAPEQISGTRAQLGPAADIHALGAILYEVLTGRPPFQGESPIETLVQVRNQEAVSPRRLNLRIPRDMETVALKCLEKAASQRYSSAAALAADLRRFLEGRPILARPGSVFERSVRWCRRRPVIAGLAAALVLAVSVGLAAVVVLWQQADVARARAEANLQMSNDVLGDLLDLSVGGENGFPKAMTLDRLIPVLEKDRKRVLALFRERPADLRVVYQLAVVEHRLCETLMQARRHEDARIMLLETLPKLGVLAGWYPVDRTARNVRALRFHFLSELSERAGKAEDCVNYRSRAVQVLEEEFLDAPSATGLEDLLDNRRGLAWLMLSRGAHEQISSLLGANSKLLESLRPECQGPMISALRLEAHIDSKVFIELLPSVTTSGAERRVAECTSPLSKLGSPIDASQSSEDWARVAAQALCSNKHADLAVGARSESENVFNVMRYLARAASRLNRTGRFELAGSIAVRMLALATYVVERHTDEPAAHLALSHAFVQIYKNAWQIDDEAAIEANLRFALYEAQQALMLDSTSEIAHHAVYSLRRRLAELNAKRKAG